VARNVSATWSDARRRHQPAADLIVTHDLKQLAVQHAELLAQDPAGDQQRFDDRGHVRMVRDQLKNSSLELDRAHMLDRGVYWFVRGRSLVTCTDACLRCGHAGGIRGSFRDGRYSWFVRLSNFGIQSARWSGLETTDFERIPRPPSRAQQHRSPACLSFMGNAQPFASHRRSNVRRRSDRG
jgi:hypothetical protein